LAAAIRDHLDPAAKGNRVDPLRAGKLPRVADRQPILRIFLLPAVAHHLAEQPEIVADAVAAGGNAEARHALHQTGGEPAETAIAERRVGLRLAHLLEIDAE